MSGHQAAQNRLAASLLCTLNSLVMMLTLSNSFLPALANVISPLADSRGLYSPSAATLADCLCVISYTWSMVRLIWPAISLVFNHHYNICNLCLYPKIHIHALRFLSLHVAHLTINSIHSLSIFSQNSFWSANFFKCTKYTVLIMNGHISLHCSRQSYHI